MSSEDTFHDQERQQLLDRYAEIATLSGGLAHEIRNPLSTMSLNLELLAEDLEESDSPRDHRMLMKIKRVQEECARLEDILNVFLRFVKVGELDTEPADLNAEIEEFTDFYLAQAREENIDVRLRLAPQLPAVNLDRKLFAQVLLNLAQNAQQAMPDGGVLELQTRQEAERVKLDLIDNGKGMTAATREKIFEAFFSTRTGGSGLGLPTVKKIIEAHSGTICCQSEPGQGTQFTITFPIVHSQSSP